VDEQLRAELVRDIRDFLERRWPLGGREGGEIITDRQLQLRAAVLMVWVMKADRGSRQDEHLALERTLARALGLEKGEAEMVIRAAEEAVAGGAPFAAVVARLDAGCTLEQKRRLVEALWRVAFADAELKGEEEYLVRKVAGLLHLTTADLMETKVRAREAFLREEL